FVEWLSERDIVDARRAVTTGAENLAAIGTEPSAEDHAAMSAKLDESPATHGVPYADCVGLAGRRDQFAVRAEVSASRRVRMTAQLGELPPRRHVPYPRYG